MSLAFLDWRPSCPARPPSSASFAPKAASTLRRSIDIVSGMAMVMAYPRRRHKCQGDLPVFPLVGSISSLPGASTPAFFGVPYHGCAIRILRSRRVATLNLGKHGGPPPLDNSIQLDQGMFSLCLRRCRRMSVAIPHNR